MTMQTGETSLPGFADPDHGFNTNARDLFSTIVTYRRTDYHYYDPKSKTHILCGFSRILSSVTPVIPIAYDDHGTIYQVISPKDTVSTCLAGGVPPMKVSQTPLAGGVPPMKVSKTRKRKSRLSKETLSKGRIPQIRPRPIMRSALTLPKLPPITTSCVEEMIEEFFESHGERKRAFTKSKLTVANMTPETDDNNFRVFSRADSDKCMSGNGVPDLLPGERDARFEKNTAGGGKQSRLDKTFDGCYWSYSNKERKMVDQALDTILK